MIIIYQCWKSKIITKANICLTLQTP